MEYKALKALGTNVQTALLTLGTTDTIQTFARAGGPVELLKNTQLTSCTSPFTGIQDAVLQRLDRDVWDNTTPALAQGIPAAQFKLAFSKIVANLTITKIHENVVADLTDAEITGNEDKFTQARLCKMNAAEVAK